MNDHTFYSDQLFQRLRRFGWVMTGHPEMTERALKTMIDDSQTADRNPPIDQNIELKLFCRALDKFETMLSGAGEIQLLSTRRVQLPGILQDLRALPIIERIAVALLGVEKFSPAEASQISGRPASVLEGSLNAASDKISLSQGLAEALNAFSRSMAGNTALQEPNRY